LQSIIFSLKNFNRYEKFFFHKSKKGKKDFWWSSNLPGLFNGITFQYSFATIVSQITAVFYIKCSVYFHFPLKAISSYFAKLTFIPTLVCRLQWFNVNEGMSHSRQKPKMFLLLIVMFLISTFYLKRVNYSINKQFSIDFFLDWGGHKTSLYHFLFLLRVFPKNGKMQCFPKHKFPQIFCRKIMVNPAGLG